MMKMMIKINTDVNDKKMKIDIVKSDVIRRKCGQTLARVRVSRTYISIIIISLQQMEST